MIRYLKYLRCLIPPGPEAPAMQILAWRWAMLSISVVALVLIASANDWIPGATGFAHARADDVDAWQTTQGRYLTRLVKSDIAEDIHADKMLWCKAETSHEKQRLRAGIDELQEEYEEVAGLGKHATEPDCA